MNKIVVLSILLGSMATVSAQSVRENILQTICDNSPTLKTERMSNEAAYWENRVGNTLSDPQVEFGFQKDFANDDSYKRQLNISQEFDLSIISGRKKRLAEAQSAVNDKEFLKAKQEVEQEVLQLLDQLVYLRKKHDMLGQMVGTNKQIVQLYDSALKRGDCSKLEYNRVRLALADAAASFQTNAIEMNTAYLRLLSYNAGEKVDTVGLSYEMKALPQDFEAWFSSVVDSLPLIQESKQQQALCEAERKMAQSGWWPKLSAGYQAERTNDENLHGLTVGLSLPLWENRNSVKAVKLKATAAEMQTSMRRQMQHDVLYQMYSQAQTMEDLNATYYKSLNEILESKGLISKAVKAGEMSLTDYLVEMTTYYDLLGKLLEAEYQYQQAKTALLIYEK